MNLKSNWSLVIISANVSTSPRDGLLIRLEDIMGESGHEKWVLCAGMEWEQQTCQAEGELPHTTEGGLGVKRRQARAVKSVHCWASAFGLSSAVQIHKRLWKG